MKKYLVVLFFVILFVSQGMASEEVYLLGSSEIGGNVSYITTTDAIERCPDWNMDQDPPLTVHQAVDIANQWIKKKYPRLDNFHINEIELVKVRRANVRKEKSWHYKIAAWGRSDLDGIMATSHFYVLVLMDGTVVEPRTRTSDNKE